MEYNIKTNTKILFQLTDRLKLFKQILNLSLLISKLILSKIKFELQNNIK